MWDSLVLKCMPHSIHITTISISAWSPTLHFTPVKITDCCFGHWKLQSFLRAQNWMGIVRIPLLSFHYFFSVHSIYGHILFLLNSPYKRIPNLLWLGHSTFQVPFLWGSRAVGFPCHCPLHPSHASFCVYQNVDNPISSQSNHNGVDFFKRCFYKEIKGK